MIVEDFDNYTVIYQTRFYDFTNHNTVIMAYLFDKRTGKVFIFIIENARFMQDKLTLDIPKEYCSGTMDIKLETRITKTTDEKKPIYKLIDLSYEPTGKQMSLKDIEKELGYKINIVS
jgi:hypothetical protein